MQCVAIQRTCGSAVAEVTRTRWNRPARTSARNCATVGDGMVPVNPPIGSTS